MPGGPEKYGLSTEDIQRMLKTADKDIHMYLETHDDQRLPSNAYVAQVALNMQALGLDVTQYADILEKCRRDPATMKTVLNALATQTSYRDELSASAMYDYISRLVEEADLATRSGQVHIDNPTSSFWKDRRAKKASEKFAKKNGY